MPTVLPRDRNNRNTTTNRTHFATSRTRKLWTRASRHTSAGCGGTQWCKTPTRSVPSACVRPWRAIFAVSHNIQRCAFALSVLSLWARNRDPRRLLYSGGTGLPSHARAACCCFIHLLQIPVVRLGRLLLYQRGTPRRTRLLAQQPGKFHNID